MLQIGCHLSVSGGFAETVRTAQSIGGTTFAFFTRNPRGSKAKKEDYADAQKALTQMKESGFGKLVAHGAYTMNLCTNDADARSFAADILMDDLRRMAQLPGNYYNFHPGSHIGQGKEQGIAYIAEALKRALAPGYPVTVLLETMAGKGTEIGGCFEDLKAIIDAVDSDQIGVCLDTCHVFDAGYDIVHDLEGVLSTFDQTIGISRLKALHLNDSKNPLSSRKDRHACLGEGYIGMSVFTQILNHPVLSQLPMILETPNDLEGYKAEIACLKSMALTKI